MAISYLLSEIIAILGGELHGVDVKVEGLAALDKAATAELSFVAQKKYIKQARLSKASALIVPLNFLDDIGCCSAIICDDPYLYFAKTVCLFYPKTEHESSIHFSAVLAENCHVGAGSKICAQVVIGEQVCIGERCNIMPGVVIGDNCVLGDDVVLYPNVTLYPKCVIGNRVMIHSGSVIGADGFGLAWDKDHWFKTPQIGRVILSDDVEIGANSTIDRGAINDTIIGKGVKIDNLVHIAHNVQIGEHTAIAGCVGIAGSSKIGANCLIGGASMFVGHIDVADHTNIGGGTLVSHSIKEPGYYASSFPLSKHHDWTRNAVHIRHLDKIVKRIKTLEQQIEEQQIDKLIPTKKD